MSENPDQDDLATKKSKSKASGNVSNNTEPPATEPMDDMNAPGTQASVGNSGNPSANLGSGNAETQVVSSKMKTARTEMDNILEEASGADNAGAGAEGASARKTLSNFAGADGNEKATIKIAAKDPSQRTGSGSPNDPGPGDPLAAPSTAVEPVDIPQPPTASDLVVKSSQPKASKSFKTLKTGSQRSPKSQGVDGAPGSNASAAPQMTGSADQAPKSKSRISQSPKMNSEIKSSSAVKQSSKISSDLKSGVSAGGAAADISAGPGATGGAASTGISRQTSSKSPKTGSQASSKGSKQSSSPAKQSMSGMPSTSGMSAIKNKDDTKSNVSADETHHHHHKKRKLSPKATKFRYHKRITVRTSGKTSPDTIMGKVNKDQPITPSTIEDMDSSELMKKAGIKGGAKTHWRVRLRQTKRTTKNGKTTTQTKFAYRDSEGNKRVKVSSKPYCKHCKKKLEDCKCDQK